MCRSDVPRRACLTPVSTRVLLKVAGRTIVAPCGIWVAVERAHAKKLIDLEIAALQEQRKAFEDDASDDAGASKESTTGAGDVELADATGKD